MPHVEECHYVSTTNAQHALFCLQEIFADFSLSSTSTTTHHLQRLNIRRYDGPNEIFRGCPYLRLNPNCFTSHARGCLFGTPWMPRHNSQCEVCLFVAETAVVMSTAKAQQRNHAPWTVKVGTCSLRDCYEHLFAGICVYSNGLFLCAILAEGNFNVPRLNHPYYYQTPQSLHFIGRRCMKLGRHTFVYVTFALKAVSGPRSLM